MCVAFFFEDARSYSNPSYLRFDHLQVIAAIMSSTIPGAGVAAATTYHEQQQQQQQQQQPDSSNFSTPSSSLTPLSVLNALLNHLVEHEKETAVLIGGLNSSLQKHSK